MHIHGQCHCGAIAYEADIDPDSAGLCHCTDCQVLSGSPYRAIVLAPVADYVPVRGTPKVYIKTAASGRPREQSFCADCGTPIYAAPVTDKTHYFLRLGAIAERADLPPRRQIWCDSALDWALVDDVPEKPGQ